MNFLESVLQLQSFGLRVREGFRVQGRGLLLQEFKF